MKWMLIEGKDQEVAKVMLDEKKQGEGWVSKSDSLGHTGKRRKERAERWKNIKKIEIPIRLWK